MIIIHIEQSSVDYWAVSVANHGIIYITCGGI